MKFRNGFVSNSSSSSFLIYGVCVDKCKILEAHARLQGKNDDEDDEDDIYSVCFPDLDLHIVPDDNVYIGVSWDQVGLDETGKQFMTRVENAVAAVFPDEVGNCDTYSEAWYG